MRKFIAFIIPLFLFCTKISVSQDFDTTKREIPALPDMTTPIAISNKNAVNYRTLIPPEIFPLVRKGYLVMNSGTNTSYRWMLDDEWKENSKQHLDSALVSSDSGPKAGADLPRGFYFGDATALRKIDDKPLLAKRILWNLYSNFAQNKIVEFDLRFYRSQLKHPNCSVNFLFLTIRFR